MKVNRREFIEAATLGVAGGAALMAQSNSNAEIPRKPLGRTGLQVSAIGVGGYHLGSAKDQNEARQIVDMAIDAGINFFDNAWDYHDGTSEEQLGRFAALSSRCCRKRIVAGLLLSA
jgi:hypothetical protein